MLFPVSAVNTEDTNYMGVNPFPMALPASSSIPLCLLSSLLWFDLICTYPRVHDGAQTAGKERHPLACLCVLVSISKWVFVVLPIFISLSVYCIGIEKRPH